MYIDNVLAVPSAMLQNPVLSTPLELANALVLLEVMHHDFEGKVKQGRIIVHELVAHQVRSFFREAYLLRFTIYSVLPVNFFNWCDEFTCSANNSSGHNMRYLDDGRMSKHGIGCAFDINPRINACYVLQEKSLLFQRIIPANGTYTPPASGTLYVGHPLVELMLGYGWAWGGNWTFPKDYQHFQIVPPELASYVQ